MSMPSTVPPTAMLPATVMLVEPSATVIAVVPPATVCPVPNFRPSLYAKTCPPSTIRPLLK